jgi:hypothetical protein
MLHTKWGAWYALGCERVVVRAISCDLALWLDTEHSLTALRVNLAAAEQHSCCQNH